MFDSTPSRAAAGGGFSLFSANGVITGPASSNYVANPGANKAYVTFYGAGGGGGGTAGTGGAGGLFGGGGAGGTTVGTAGGTGGVIIEYFIA